MDSVWVIKGAAGLRLQEVIELCRRSGVTVRFADRAALDRMVPGTVHQGVVARAAGLRFQSIEDITAAIGLVVALDGVEDPHNLGAIIRTAHAAGAGAVVIPERRAAGVTPVVAKAAAGALEHIAMVRVTNLNRALEALKKTGFWVYGLDERGTACYDTVAYGTPAVFVAGAEGKGLHQLTRERCDSLVRIPMTGRVASLNVSVATGIVLFEWRRRTPH
jgi:23S rRNA (guanosine2251-2'-O)-methyltransferase